MLFKKLAHFIVGHSKTVLVLFILLILASGGFGTLVFNKLDTEGYLDPNSDSYKVSEYLKKEYSTQDPEVILIIDGQKNPVNAPTVRKEAHELEKAIQKIQGVDHTLSYWSTGNSPVFVSKDGKAAYLFVYAKTSSQNNSLAKDIQEKFDGNFKSLKVYATGKGVIDASLNSTIAKDLLLAEAVSIPLTFGLLLFVFGTLVSSAIPVFMGICSIFGALFLLWIMTTITSVSVFALNLVTGMGLGLGIDYSLLMINRFREELKKNWSVKQAVIETMATAGKTVFYSGLTVMVTLGALILFPQPMLKSFGYAGISVVFIAIFTAIFPLPALMHIFGRNIDKGVIRKSAVATKEKDGNWAKTARFVMRYPIRVSLVCFALLSVLIFPIKNIVFSQTDARVLPSDNRALIAYNVLQDRFPSQESSPVEIIIPDGKAQMENVRTYAQDLSKVPGVVRVNPIQFNQNDVRIDLLQSYASKSSDATQMIEEIRDIKHPKGTIVGGESAEFVDSQNGIIKSLPKVLLAIVLSVLLLLFVFTGSILLPIKAIVLNILSLGATMGVLTYIFIEGHLKWLVGDFNLTGSLDTGTSIMVAVVVFGLSMDYELFLLSRIKEEYSASHSNESAVAVGLQKSAHIITAAALILATVFAAFVTSGVTPIKFMGFGVAFAVLLDATIIRAFLVPALMRLFGNMNWWAPKFLKKFTLDH